MYQTYVGSGVITIAKIVGRYDDDQKHTCCGLKFFACVESSIMKNSTTRKMYVEDILWWAVSIIVWPSDVCDEGKKIFVRGTTKKRRWWWGVTNFDIIMRNCWSEHMATQIQFMLWIRCPPVGWKVLVFLSCVMEGTRIKKQLLLLCVRVFRGCGGKFISTSGGGHCYWVAGSWMLHFWRRARILLIVSSFFSQKKIVGGVSSCFINIL